MGGKRNDKYGNKKEIIGYMQEVIQNNEKKNIAINGSWGIGKSYLIEDVNKRLMHNKALIIDTWKLSDLVRLEEMIKYEFLKNKKKYLKNAPKTEIKKLLKASTIGFNKIINQNSVIGISAEIIKTVTDVEKSIENQNIKLEKEYDFLKALKDVGVEYIFIDELDRCLPETAIDIFKQIIFINKAENQQYPLFITSLNLEAFSSSLKHLYGESYQTEAFFDKTFDVILDVKASLEDKYNYLALKLDDENLKKDYSNQMEASQIRRYGRGASRVETMMNKMTFRKLELVAKDINRYKIDFSYCDSCNIGFYTYLVDLFCLKTLNYSAYFELMDENIKKIRWKTLLEQNLIYASDTEYSYHEGIVKQINNGQPIKIDGDRLDSDYL